MNKFSVVMLVLNVALAAVIFGQLTFKSSSSSEGSSQNGAYEVKVDTISADDKEALPVILKNLEQNKRKNRVTARYFLPMPGERNALTDAVDGMVIEGMRRSLPIISSFDKLLEEEGIVKAEKYKQRNKFQSVVREYLQTVYKIQRGMEEGDIADEQEKMKNKLFNEVSLDSARLERLIEIEKGKKSSRQLKVFEQLLIRDDDKLSEDQKKQVSEILAADQTTLFDPPLKENEILDVVRNCNFNPEKSKKYMLFYLGQFFNTLKNKKTMKRESIME